MVRKTKKHLSSKHKKKGIYSIPELRRSFEHIEHYVNEKIASHETKEKLVKDLRKEWSRVFFKDLDKPSAEAFIQHHLSNKKHNRHRTLRRSGGAGAQLANTYTPIAGAPNDYVTRQGIYLAPGQIPDKAGHLPLSDGSKSSFGSYVQYVDKGFWNPEPGQSYDPVPGQTRFPTSTPVGMGDNTVHFTAKGGKRKTKKARKIRGGAPLGMASVPSGFIKDIMDTWNGKQVGISPDQIQNPPNYHYNHTYPKAISM